MAQQLGEIGGAVYPAHAGQAFGGTLQRGQGIGARQVIDHHHADHLPTDFTHPQVAERLRGRRGQEGFGGERRGGELRSLQRLAHRLGHGRQHAGFHLRGQRGIGLLARRRRQPIADRAIAANALVGGQYTQALGQCFLALQQLRGIDTLHQVELCRAGHAQQLAQADLLRHQRRR